MAISELPEEIMIDIFSRLPAKSVGKCRCLSKPWRNILSTPKFIKSHLNRKTLNQQNLLLVTKSTSIRTIADVKNGAVSRKLGLGDDWKQVVGSCHGLVLLMNDENEKFLVNPITLQKAKIPNAPPLPLEWRESYSIHGFGYDSSIDDYKSVTLHHHYEFAHIFVDVYYVKQGVWKRVEKSSRYDHSVTKYFSYGAYLNGAIHWLAPSWKNLEDFEYVITVFDLAHEVFDEIPAPSGVKTNFMYYDLVVLGGCLCIVDARTSTLTDFWIMKEYGSAESWSKFSIDCNYEWAMLRPLCYIGDGEVALFCEEREYLVVYNMKEKTLKKMVVDRAKAYGLDVCIFEGSLLSPSFGTS